MEPQELLYWMRKWELDDKLIWKKSSERQACFVRNKVAGNLLKSKCFVVSTHHSKSCLLPVYYIKMRNGIKIIMRENFYDWKVSVVIPDDYPDLKPNTLPDDCLSYSMVKSKTEKISSCYLEGFKDEWSFDAYIPEKPGKRFTIEVPDDERLYVVLHTLKHAYPDVTFNVDDDKRSMEEIKGSIDRIFNENGFNDMEEVEEYGKKRLDRYMSGWEILWRTYIAMDNLPDESRKTIENFYSVGKDSAKFAEVVLKFPQVHAEFLMEEWMFNKDIL